MPLGAPQSISVPKIHPKNSCFGNKRKNIVPTVASLDAQSLSSSKNETIRSYICASRTYELPIAKKIRLPPRAGPRSRHPAILLHSPPHPHLNLPHPELQTAPFAHHQTSDKQRRQLQSLRPLPSLLPAAWTHRWWGGSVLNLNFRNYWRSEGNAFNFQKFLPSSQN